MSASWPDERIELLVQAFNAGDSASVIAASLSTAAQRITRNAVIGRWYRMGLRRVDIAPAIRTARKPHPKHRLVKREKFKPHVKLAEPPPAREVTPVPELSCDDIPVGQRRTLGDLTIFTCRWPCGRPGTPDFFYCGHPSADMNDRRPYCAAHTARAFQRGRA